MNFDFLFLLAVSAIDFNARVGDIEVYVKGVKHTLIDVPFAIYGYNA